MSCLREALPGSGGVLCQCPYTAERSGRWWRTLLLLLFLFLLAPSTGFGASGCHDEHIVVTDSTEHIPLASCLWYREDPSHKQTLSDVRNDDDGLDGFTEHHQGLLNFGYTESAYWVRFDLRYVGEHAERDYILELELPLADEADLYLIEDGRVVGERQFRYAQGWEQRDLNLPNPNFRLELQQNQTVTAYLRVYTQNTFRLPLHLWAPAAYAEEIAISEFFHGAFLGAMLAIFVYNLFVTLVVREKGYLFYMLYLVFGTLFILTEQVHGQQIFGHQVFLLDKGFLHYWIIVAWLWALLMARDLLETKANAPGLDQLLSLAVRGTIATLVLSLFIRYHVSMQWTVIGSVILVLLMLFTSYRALRIGIPSARNYLAGWSMVLLSVGIYALTVMGYLPVNTITAHMPQLGFASQVVLLSFAMARRIKVVQEQALRWNETAVANLQRYRSLFDNAIEGIFQMSLGSRFIEANPALAHMLGYRSARELLRHSPNVLEACFADPAVRARVREALSSSGQVKGFEAAYVDHLGRERWASVSLRAVYQADGTATHLEGTFVDMTERKEREKVERERENERLEKEVARNSAASKSQFLANMSHEIRTPLAAIIGYGETLLEPDLDDEQKRNSAETVVRSGRHLLDLINDILDHSKIDANKLDVEILTVNLPELIEEVRAFFAPRAREKGLEFRIIYDFPLPELIRTDPTRLRQILINLCANALKFTERGHIHVRIRCDRPRQQLVATVVDTGIGMKREQLDRLFDPFAQGSSDIARQYGGTGLGLSISKRLCELLGGSIRVRSQYGEGSEFEAVVDTGSLEGVRLIHGAPEMTGRRQRLQSVATPQLKGRILYAEDNEVNRKLVSLLVQRTGAEIVHVTNGAEALELGLQGGFDVILMDIQMPVMNGRDATRALREAGINTPVIALTANVMAEDVQDYRDAGCNDFLAKPIDKMHFYETLSRYLRPLQGEIQVTPDDPSEAGPKYHGAVLVAEANPEALRVIEAQLRGVGLDVVVADTGPRAVQLAMAKTVGMVFLGHELPEMSAVDVMRLLRQTGFRRPIIAYLPQDTGQVEPLAEAGFDEILLEPVAASIGPALARHLTPAPEDHLVQEGPEDPAMKALQGQFMAGLPARLESMAQARQQGNWEQLQMHAHQLKGSAGAMGYPLITERAGELEAALRAQELNRANELSTVVEQLLSEAFSTDGH